MVKLVDIVTSQEWYTVLHEAYEKALTRNRGDVTQATNCPAMAWWRNLNAQYPTLLVDEFLTHLEAAVAAGEVAKSDVWGLILFSRDYLTPERIERVKTLLRETEIRRLREEYSIHL